MTTVTCSSQSDAVAEREPDQQEQQRHGVEDPPVPELGESPIDPHIRSGSITSATLSQIHGTIRPRARSARGRGTAR